jgi:hypothetical protein
MASTVTSTSATTPTTTTTTTPVTKEVKLDLQDQVIPSAAWIPLADEIKEVEKDKLIDALIIHINKAEFPPRFKTPAQAYAYFGIMSAAQITRLNKLVEEIKAGPKVEPVILPKTEPASKLIEPTAHVKTEKVPEKAS